jgi:8-oxo-dGTP diphosphatase
MSLPGQRVQPERYQVIPRTLIFLLCEAEILLVRIAEDRGAWAGLYNGLGGHIEQGELPYTAAEREIKEETGLSPDSLHFCGVIIVDTGSSPGIGIHVFVGTATKQELTPSMEGNPAWIPLDSLDQIPLVDDLPHIIPKALDAYRSGKPFTALTLFDNKGKPLLRFIP